LYPTKIEFISEGSGLWQYGVTFAFNLITAEEIADEDLPVLKHADFEDELGSVEVIVIP